MRELLITAAPLPPPGPWTCNVAQRQRVRFDMKLPNSNFDLDHRTSYRFALLSSRSVRSTRDLYHRHGLTTYRWRTLSLIGHHEPIYPSEIAEITSVDPDQVTRAVDQLVTQHYVARNLDSADRRRVQLTLTPKGRGIYAEIETVHRAIEKKLLSVLSAEEREAFFNSLAKLEAQARYLFHTNGNLKHVAGLSGDTPTKRPRAERTRKITK
jgi:DNA-binding MarR family transcriptional regulator